MTQADVDERRCTATSAYSSYPQQQPCACLCRALPQGSVRASALPRRPHGRELPVRAGAEPERAPAQLLGAGARLRSRHAAAQRGGRHGAGVCSGAKRRPDPQPPAPLGRYASARCVHSREGPSESHPLTRSAAALLLLGVCVRCLLRGARGAVQATREAAVLLAGVYLLSPLLQTLTGTVSGDSVSAMVVASLLAHLYLHDYHFGRDVAHTLQGCLSLAAALFASVLLASRLDSPQAVFALLCCALQAFVAWPFLRRDILGASPAAHVALTAALHVGTCGALGRVSGVLAGAHASLLIFITFVCPWSLVQCHGIKQRINGCERLQT